MTIFIFLLLILTTPILSNAQSFEKEIQTITNSNQTCLDKGGNMLGCSKRYYYQIDSMLNVVYRHIRVNMTAPEKDELKRKQLLWLKERDKEFKNINNTDSGLGPGSLDDLMFKSQEKANYVLVRIKHLIDNYSENWIGEYKYSEPPLKALADYYMTMEWSLKILKSDLAPTATIEINGQQTYMVIEATTEIQANKIKLLFRNGIDGGGYEQFHKGDLLFELEKKDGRLITTWNQLKPRLKPDYELSGECFSRK